MENHLALIYYITDLLKYISVPAAAFEFLSKEKQKKVENWLIKKLPKLVWNMVFIFFITLLLILLLIYGSYYIVIAYYIFIKIIRSSNHDLDSNYVIIPTIISIIAIVFSILYSWVIPEIWVQHFLYPIELVTNNLNQHNFIEPIIPDFSSQEFTSRYESFFDSITSNDNPENKRWWHYFLSLYFFISKGFLIIIIIAINLSLLMCIAGLTLLLVLSPFNLFIKISNNLKSYFSLDEGNIPIGAFLIWAIGETIAIAFKSYEMFLK